VEKLTMAVAFSIDGEATSIEIVRRRPRLVLRIGRRDYEVVEEAHSGSRHRLRVDGEAVEIAACREGDAAFVWLRGRTWNVQWIDPRRAAGGFAENLDEIRAPMPGVIVSVNKAKGEMVRRGEAVVTIESMKLQMSLPAPRDGIVAALNKAVEDSVAKDEIVATLFAAGGAE
jgi:acetyl/propionyl-CoA carboxylase alpha subunit